ncbi:hypothetical protein G5V59_06915 [Nocardioides sp. W3-2-3]|nr:hypothetical protein [Nocardioides convexus]NHA00030.1 hypothetical protein [Nocardioides convexus]
MFSTIRRSRLVRSAAVLSVLAVAASGCDGSGFSPGGGGDDSPETTAAAVVKAKVTANVTAGATGVPVNTVLKVAASDGTLSAVTVTSKAGPVPGKIVGGERWVARLAPRARCPLPDPRRRQELGRLHRGEPHAVHHAGARPRPG